MEAFWIHVHGIVLILYLCVQLNLTLADMYGANCTKNDPKTLKCTFIPKTLPDRNITRVRIVHFSKYVSPTISNENFTDSWGDVTYLEISDKGDKIVTFENGSFEHLKRLVELQIHLTQPFELHPDTFVGLDTVRTLNMGNCFRGRTQDLLAALNVSNKLPNMNKLVLSSWSNIKEYIEIDEKFVETLSPRDVTYIDVSNTQMSSLNASVVLKGLKHLEYFNISFANIIAVTTNGLVPKDLLNLKLVDGSHIRLPKKTFPLIPRRFVYGNVTIDVPDKTSNTLNLLVTPETINVSGVVPDKSSFEFDNLTIILSKNITWLTKNFIGQINSVKRLDVRFECNGFESPNIETFDLSRNGLEFIHPDFFRCFSNITEIRLSNNNLNKMLSEDSFLFERLFSKFENLKMVTLSENNLKTLPRNTFVDSSSVEVIDLSYNNLMQIEFILCNLDFLKLLNLAHNNIQNLDSRSLSHLDSIPRVAGQEYSETTVIFKSNPISCGKCGTKHFIEWLTKTNLTNVKHQQLTCECRGKGHECLIDDGVLRIVEKICERQKIVIAVATISAVLSIIAIAIATVYYRRRRRAKKLQNRTNIISRLREGYGQYEFVVFLSYSSNDEDFVTTNIRAQLNENLQLMTGIERDLVCTGDEHLRCGFQIQEETWTCMDRASVVMVVVSESFCSSGYCRGELDQAYIKRKPVLLMLIEHVDEDVMMPTMREMYRKNVRILWTKENGQMLLKSSWENVCKSILDIVLSDK